MAPVSEFVCDCGDLTEKSRTVNSLRVSLLVGLDHEKAVCSRSNEVVCFFDWIKRFSRQKQTKRKCPCPQARAHSSVSSQKQLGYHLLIENK